MPDIKELCIGSILGLIIGSIIFWFIGNLRVQSVEQEFTAYKQKQTAAYNKAITESNKRMEETRNEYAERESLLRAEIQNNTVVNRAIAAGRLRKPTCPSSDPIQATTRIDETSTDTVSTPGESATEGEYPVVNDCAKTTLMLNMLQWDIEKQLSKGTE